MHQHNFEISTSVLPCGDSAALIAISAAAAVAPTYISNVSCCTKGDLVIVVATCSTALAVVVDRGGGLGRSAWLLFLPFLL